MIFGLITVPIISLFTPKPDAKVVEESFACYEQKVLVSQKEALADED
jgi:SSS family solute:Na+ symporter